MSEVIEKQVVGFDEEEMAIISTANIVVFHAKHHAPRNKIEGVSYVGSNQSINVQSASEMMGCESVALPITFNAGRYHHMRVNDYHQTVGVSMVSCEDIKLIVNNYRLSEKEHRGFRLLLAKVNHHSYC